MQHPQYAKSHALENLIRFPSSERQVSALICTRNRGDSLVATVKSILQPNSMCCELIIIDQSDDQKTRIALTPFYHDKRLRYIHTDSKGKGIALNLGIEIAHGEFIAITDDDCCVEQDWPRHQYETLLVNPQAAIAYGSVIAAEYDIKTGYIPAYAVSQNRMCRNVWDKLSARGIGANTVVRRQAVLELGGFDNSLGPGGKFKACIDGDMTLKCILSGKMIFESSKSSVIHYGFRDWESGRAATYNAWYGIGATCAKPLKLGRPDAIVIGFHEFFNHAFFPFLKAILTGKRPSGWLRVKGFLEGMLEGLKTRVDPNTMNYISVETPEVQSQIASLPKMKFPWAIRLKQM